MDKIIIVLFEASVSFLLFYLVYFLWLRKETFFKANRFYLLLTALFSLLIPLLQFNIPGQQGQEVVVYNLLETITINAVGYEQGLVESLSAWQWISVVYFAGVLVSLTMLAYKAGKIIALKNNKNTASLSEYGQHVRFVKANIYPFSFLNKIYVNPEKYTREELDKIIAHENIHINQQHTYDCLFYELLIVIFWFHPIVYKYRTSAKVLHEYLADEGAIRSGVSPISYQKLLFEEATGLSTVTLANSFNYSLVKRRLIMLTKNKSSKWNKMRLLYLFPVLMALVVIFACNKAEESIEQKSTFKSKGKTAIVMPEETKNGEKVYFEVDKMPEFPGGEQALRQYIARHVIYPGKAKETRTEGKVYIQFVVNKMGKVEQVKHVATRAPVKERNEIGEIVVASYTEVFHREGKSFDELSNEGERVVSSLPDWTPGELDGKPVNVSFTIPINFALQ